MTYKEELDKLLKEEQVLWNVFSSLKEKLFNNEIVYDNLLSKYQRAFDDWYTMSIIILDLNSKNQLDTLSSH